jgi:DnaK suppressor protein
VENALRRLALGTFGVCEMCDEAIPVARLQALPYATRCVKCQRTAETNRGTPTARFVWPTNDDNSAENDLSMDNMSAELGLYA